MMERKEEYEALLSALEREVPPAALDHCVEKARKRAKQRRLSRDWGAALASLGGLAAAFALAVNLSLPFALACGRLPVLRDLAAAVAVSPSLREAVKNDFVQIVDQSQTIEGVTMTVDYVIADKRQVNLFYHFDGDFGSIEGYPEYLAADGRELEPSSRVSNGMPAQPGETRQATINFQNDTPSGLRFLFPVRSIEPPEGEKGGQTPAPESRTGAPRSREEPKAALFTFSFDLTFNPYMIAQGETYEVDQWIELDGQRVLIESAEIYPSFLQLNLSYDPDNTAWLTGLEFYLEDESGQRTERIKNGISGHGSADSPATSALRQESSFFWNSKHLTFHVVSADWLDKDRQYVTVDLDRGATADPLPEGVLWGGAARIGSGVEIALFSKEPPESNENNMIFYEVVSSTALTPDGEEIFSDSSSSTSGEIAFVGDKQLSVPEGYFTETLYFQNCPYDTLTLEMRFSHRDVLPTAPVSVSVK